MYRSYKELFKIDDTSSWKIICICIKIIHSKLLGRRAGRFKITTELLRGKKLSQVFRHRTRKGHLKVSYRAKRQPLCSFSCATTDEGGGRSATTEYATSDWRWNAQFFITVFTVFLTLHVELKCPTRQRKEKRGGTMGGDEIPLFPGAYFLEARGCGFADVFLKHG